MVESGQHLTATDSNPKTEKPRAVIGRGDNDNNKLWEELVTPAYLEMLHSTWPDQGQIENNNCAIQLEKTALWGAS